MSINEKPKPGFLIFPDRTYRIKVLDCYIFKTFNEVRRMTKEWRQRYDHELLHESLGRIPPIQFAMAKYHQPLL
ncbi:MAG: hypothetical protein E6Q59_00185 [Nitrosomonas sp.]|nr:transposase [Nitrosomonas sp.]TXI42914.1 MAG: hypothetical protein E6Q59_00185 [Nitrosomonas sp.]